MVCENYYWQCWDSPLNKNRLCDLVAWLIVGQKLQKWGKRLMPVGERQMVPHESARIFNYLLAFWGKGSKYNLV